MNKRIGAVAGLVMLALGSGCVVVGRRRGVAVVAPVPVVSMTYVDREPPPANDESLPEPPRGDYVWCDGYWRWDARAYVWVPGRYVLRPHPRAVWVGGHWVRHERGWYWTEGHWR
jgi:hypothetical protein